MNGLPAIEGGSLSHSGLRTASSPNGQSASVEVGYFFRALRAA